MTVNNAWDQIKNLVWNVFNRPNIADVLDIFIVAYLIYKLLMLTKETRASAVLKGLVMLIAASWTSDLLGLTALSWVLQNVVANGAVVLVILFQPELRKALEQIGRGAIRERATGSESAQIVSEITHCMLNLSRRRVGALIVIEQRIGLKDVVETGTTLNSEISSALLENIFEPNTPLHDGAVVIRGNRIMAAACILTLSEGKGISRELGTRHRAAIWTGRDWNRCLPPFISKKRPAFCPACWRKPNGERGTRHEYRTQAKRDRQRPPGAASGARPFFAGMPA